MASHETGTPIRKVLISAFGDVSNIGVISSSISAPASGHVQVAPLYSGFSGADVNMRRGQYPFQRKAPLTPGYCLVGRVVSSHSSSKKFAPGALVASLSVYDAQATLVNLPEKHLIPVPEDLDPRTATAIVLDWATAYQMVTRAAKVTGGQRVFIHGLSGAVGNALSKLCVSLGAVVYGTASPRNHASLIAQGATGVFPYSNKDWIDQMNALGKVHAVFDPLGFESWDESYSILSCSETSILVGYGGQKGVLEESGHHSVIGPTMKLYGRNAKFWQRKRTTFYYISRDDSNYQTDVLALFEMARKGEIDVTIKKVWAMEDIQEAHLSYGKSEGVGTLLIKVSTEESR